MLLMGSEFRGMNFFGTNFFGDIRIPYLSAVLNQRSCTVAAGKANVRKVIFSRFRCCEIQVSHVTSRV
jgi:hypothetical protein